jgi:hypothetical protein
VRAELKRNFHAILGDARSSLAFPNFPQKRGASYGEEDFGHGC